MRSSASAVFWASYRSLQKMKSGITRRGGSLRAAFARTCHAGMSLSSLVDRKSLVNQFVEQPIEEVRTVDGGQEFIS